MPRRVHYFPVDHDINHNEKMRELAKEFGFAGWRIWFEILSIGDRNDGLVDCTSPGAISRLTSAAQTKHKITSDVVLWLFFRGCVVSEDKQNHVSRIANYWKYHRTPEPKPVPSEPDRTYPDKTLKKEQEPAKAPEPAADLKQKEGPPGLDSKIKAAAEPIYRSNPVKFRRLIVWIKDKEKRDYPVETIAGALALYWEQEQKHRILDWWPYLNRVFTKQYGRWNEEQAAKQKSSDRLFVRDLLKATAGGLGG